MMWKSASRRRSNFSCFAEKSDLQGRFFIAGLRLRRVFFCRMALRLSGLRDGAKGGYCAYPAYTPQYKKGDPKVAFFCLVAEKLIKP